jgi:putative NADH-flavin reductase
MKVLITGATGTIGKEALNQALLRPEITLVVALTRRSLPSSISANPKLKTIIMKDFSTWEPNVLEEIKDADAMIWFVNYAYSRLVEGLPKHG